MIGDIFIGLLLIFSAAINLLAIGSFWVTPSLRTTTNRFVANLLICNFLSCLVLSPAAFSPAITSSSSTVDVPISNDNVNKSLDYMNISSNASMFNNASSQSSRESGVTSVERIENIMERYQSCSLDFVVAVSVLSMLLVVMDTFIAVTDPLRYHSRISEFKAWLLISLCWIIGISVGIASALQSSTEIIMNDNISNGDGGCVYNTMFLITYFVSIVLTPFLLVILMYWRIFTEARESGQRMRQNGSSPLLQSALNLATSATSAHQQQSQSQHNSLPSPQCLLLVTSPSLQSCKQLQQSALNKQKTSDNNSNSNIVKNKAATTPPSTVDGLTMIIDKQDYYGVNNNLSQHDNYHQFPFSHSDGKNETKTFVLSSPPHELMPILATINEADKISTNEDNEIDSKNSRQHQNILLTLTTACEDASVKRNQSAKHLLMDDSTFFTSHDESRLLELRQVRSSPNLIHSFEPADREQRMSQTQETLELPQSVQASPKALRYMNSLRHRLSNASSLFKYREEGRAARISILVVIMFLLTYFPYGLLSLIHGQNNIIKESNLSFLSILFVLLANLCSPFIFAYRNKRVRKGVQRLLGIDTKTNERLEKLNSLKKSYSTRIKNYRQNQLHKSFNFGSRNEDNVSQKKNNNIRRSQTFTACKYLTPPDANAKTITNSSSFCYQQQPKNIKSSINIKEKKSILKIVCDGSKKLALSNCQNGQLETMIGVEVDSDFIEQQNAASSRPVDV